MCNSLKSHGLQHARVPSPPLSPRVYSDSCPLNQWCCLTILSSAALFSFCLLQSFPASESFPMNWLFALDGQSTGASTLASVLPVNFQSCSFHYYLLINEKLKHHIQGDVLAPPSQGFGDFNFRVLWPLPSSSEDLRPSFTFQFIQSSYTNVNFENIAKHEWLSAS